MARLQLEPDEHVLDNIEITVVHEDRRLPAKILITTNRLLVVAGPKIGRGLGWYLGAFLAQAIRALSAGTARRVLYQIRRDRYGAVEQGERGLLVFHDTGEGYAHVSFAITEYTGALVWWQNRLRDWASGRGAAAPLPAATVVTRKP